MAIININIPDNVMNRIEDGIAKYKGRPAQVPDPGNPASEIPNPETKNQFLMRAIKEFIVNMVAEQEATDEAKSKGDTKRNNSKSELAGIVVTP